MFNDKPMKVNRRRRKNMLLPALALIVSSVALSLGIAAFWQAASGDGQKLVTSSANSSSSTAQSEPELSSSLPSSMQESSSEPEPEPQSLTGAVPESESVGDDYFDDAVFVGDSITTGIAYYKVMNSTDVLAETGLNLASVYTKEAVKLEDGTRITVMAGLEKTQYKKVYIQLGGNEVRDEDKQTFIARYDKFIEDVRTLQPDALLYVQSIFPVTKGNNYKMDNGRIDEFNAALLELCVEKKVYYLNVAECLKDETGMLPTAASPYDGMHFGKDYYMKWIDYLKSHTVSQRQEKEKTA